MEPRAYGPFKYVPINRRRRISWLNGARVAICLHPYIIGQPHRIGALDRALDYICAHDGVWKATGTKIVEHYLKPGITW